MIQLTLPYPLSANRYWATRVIKQRATGRYMAMTYVTPEAKAYKDQVAWLAKRAGLTHPLIGRIGLAVQLYPKRPQDWARRARLNPAGWDDDVMCLDLDNANKVLLDALKEVVIEDDRWVRRIVSQRMEPDGDARVVLKVWQITAEQRQADLLEGAEA